MDKITKFIETRISPIANKIIRQRHIQAIQNVFLSLIPFMTIGSFALIAISPAMDYTALDPGFVRTFFHGWQMFADKFTYPFESVFMSAMGLLSIYVSLGVAHNLAKTYKMETFIPSVISLAVFMIFSAFTLEMEFTIDYFDGTGLFTAIILALLSVECYKFLIDKKVGEIKVGGQGVPEALTESFTSFIPVTIILIVSGFISVGIYNLTGTPLPALIGTLISPLVMLVDNVFGVALLSVAVMVLWWFGIHDTVITGPLTPIFYSNLALNTAAVATGVGITQLPHIVTNPFWFTFMAIGGSGATFGLVILCSISKSKHIRTVGRLSLVPAFFNINEPIIFGLPIMFNPILFIPFVSAMTINGIITYLLMNWELIGRTFVNPSWNMFSPIGALISTTDIKALVLVLGLIILNTLIYLPFFKVYEKQKIAEELAEEIN